ncbi:MAG: glycosyltransferase [Deltaproteobacteria bacterium]|nr:glycosyltransferase [Deltaproteobacteria bacterium]
MTPRGRGGPPPPGGGLVSVVLPAWNRAWALGRSALSVLRQEGAAFELIVVDDGSRDETPELLAAVGRLYAGGRALDDAPPPAAGPASAFLSPAALAAAPLPEGLRALLLGPFAPPAGRAREAGAARTPPGDAGPPPPAAAGTGAAAPRSRQTGFYRGPDGAGTLRIFTNKRNLGVSASRNIGIKAASGDLVCFLDSDDEYLPGKLKAQREFMEADPTVMISQCQERWTRGGVRVNPGLRHLKRAGDIFVDSLKLCLISPSAVVLRASLFSETGLFDESLPACEDYDLWLRILADREAGLLDRELVVRHGGRPDQLSAAPGLDRYRIRALKKILRQKLSPEKRSAAETELALRRKIFESGLRKRLARR